MTVADDSVIIAGGGIAGLALARALAATGRASRVFERRGSDADPGLAINLPGNAIAALSALGLRDRVEAVGRPVARREYRSASDKLLFAIDEDVFWGPAMRPRAVRRADLHAMLAEGLPAGTLVHGIGVTGASQDGERVSVQFDDGRATDTPLLVAADGVRSAVRTSVFGAGHDPDHAILARASWRFMAPNPGVFFWTVWQGRHGMVLLMPVSDDEVYGWAALSGGSDAQDKAEALREMVAAFPERVRRAVNHALSHAGALHHSPLEEARLSHWHRGRVVLIGDAAHATAPVWAQGAALALEDAIVLARLLGSGSAVPAALAAFEAERRPRVAHVAALTDAMAKAAKLPPLVRRTLWPLIGPKRYRQTYEPLKTPV